MGGRRRHGANLSPVPSGRPRGERLEPTGQTGQPGSVRLRLFLLMTAVLVATAGATAAVDEQLSRRSGEDQTIGGGTDVSAGSTSSTQAPAAEIVITGSATGGHLDGAEIEPATIATPLTLTAERGFGNGAEITAVDVDGLPSAIVWDGGRPFALASGGALILGRVRIDLASGELHLGLAGATHRFEPGTYTVDTPVAVGSTGVGRALEAVTFEAGVASLLEANGDTSLTLAADGAVRASGGGPLHLEGAFTLVEGSTTRSVSSIETTAGDYDLSLTPAPDGRWTIRAAVRGRVVAT